MILIRTVKEYQLFGKQNWQDIKCNNHSWSDNYIKHMLSTILDKWTLISIVDFMGTTIVKIWWSEYNEKLLTKYEARILKDWEFLKEKCSLLDDHEAKNFCARYGHRITLEERICDED